MLLDAHALRSFIDDLVEPVLGADAQGKLLLANASARALLSLPGGVAGGPVAEILAAHPQLRVARTTPLSAPLGAVLYTLAPAEGPHDQIRSELERERALLARALANHEAAERRAQSLAEVSRLFLDPVGADPSAPLRQGIGPIAQTLEAPCVFCLATPRGLEPTASAGPSEPCRDKLEGQIAAAAAELGPLLDAPGPQRFTWSPGAPLDGAWVAPLRSHGERLGLLIVGAPAGRFLDDPEFVGALADRAALAVSHARLAAALAAQRDEARNARGSLEALVRHAPVGVAFLDPQLRFVLANEVVATLDGLPAHEHRGRALEEVWPSNLAQVTGDLRAALERGEEGVRRELALSRGGEARYYDVAYHPVRAEDGELLGVTAIVVDQTPQVRARRRIEELVLAEQRRVAELVTLLHANPNAIVVFGPDDRVRYVSGQFAALFGARVHELSGLHVREVLERIEAIGLRDAARVRARTEQLFADRTLALNDEVELSGARPRFFRRSSAPVLGANGAYLGRLLVMVEVTAERELDRERTDFLTVASHELKTPLTPLSIGLQAVERRIARGEPVAHELVVKARRQLTRLNTLIDDLLDFSRVESGRLELQSQLFTLDALAAEVVSDLAAASPTHLIELVRKAERVRIRGDRSRVEQVLVNLVQNAVKYSPRGGRVEVVVEVREGEAAITVSDEGIGIPIEDQGRLFERFFRAHNANTRQFAGLGIGLHVAREIVQRHGGRFEVESAPQRGSAFRFFLPLARNVAEGPAVLFVDDGAEDVARARQALEAEGWRIERAALDVALDALEARGCRGLVVDLGGFGESWKASWARLRTSPIWATAFLAVLPPGVPAAEGIAPGLARPFAPEVLAQWLRERLEPVVERVPTELGTLTIERR